MVSTLLKLNINLPSVNMYLCSINLFITLIASFVSLPFTTSLFYTYGCTHYSYSQTHTHTYTHTYIHTHNIHTYIYTHTHTHIHPYVFINSHPPGTADTIIILSVHLFSIYTCSKGCVPWVHSIIYYIILSMQVINQS